MNNFDICYNALCRAFHKENVIMPPSLVKILKPNDVVYSSITLTNTSNTDSESDPTTNNDTDSSDESDHSDNIVSNKTVQENVNSGSNAKSITRSFSSLTLTTNTHPLNLSLSSLTLTTKANPLDLPGDRKCRQEIFNKLNQLIFKIRQQKRKTNKKEVYDLPPLVKQIIRCLYPSDIDDKNYLQKPDLIFTLQTFVELFRI